MGGILTAIGGNASSAYSLTPAVLETEGEPGICGGSTTIIYGYGYHNTDGGSLSPTDYAGHTISVLYWDTSSNKTLFYVSGDAHLLTPVLKVNGVNQNLGAGTYYSGSGITIFQTSTFVSNPFSVVGTPVNVTIE